MFISETRKPVYTGCLNLISWLIFFPFLSLFINVNVCFLDHSNQQFLHYKEVTWMSDKMLLPLKTTSRWTKSTFLNFLSWITEHASRCDCSYIKAELFIYDSKSNQGLKCLQMNLSSNSRIRIHMSHQSRVQQSTLWAKAVLYMLNFT